LGLAFLAAMIWLTYWLLFIYEVRNIIGLILIVVFLAIPCLIALLKIPWELRGLIAVLQSDDPASVDKALGDLREREPM
jgi:hypothetical protein